MTLKHKQSCRDAILQARAGARFECDCRQFTQTAMSTAEHEKTRECNVFWSGTEVTAIGEPLLLPDAEAERWKPNEDDHRTKLLRSLD